MDRYLLLPLLAPLVLIAAGNDAFGFDPPGWLDAFMYVGYFWHYPEHLPLFDDYYKISRLPWILPGFAAHSLGGVIAGSLILAYLTMAAGAVALYLLVRDTLEDRTAAAVIGVAWACCTWVHGIGGWSYHVLAAGASYLMACCLIVRAARGPSPVLSATMAGACFASAVHTHVFLVTFTPLLAVLYWSALPQAVQRPFTRMTNAALLVLAGGFIATFVLAGINRATGGAWLFFMPQIEQAMSLSSGNDRWWVGMTAQWLSSARYLVIPLALMAAGLIVPLVSRGDRRRRLLLVLVGLAWAALAIMCFFQFVQRQTTLDYSYMAFVVYLHAFPCAAAAVAVRRDGAEQGERPLLTIGIATTVILGTLLVLLPTPLPGFMNSVSTLIGLGRLAPIVAPLVISLVGVAATQWMRGPARLIMFAIWFAVVNAWIAPSPTAYGIGTPGIGRQMMTLFREADGLTTELDPTLLGIKYWISNDQITTAQGVVPLGAVFDSYVATRTWLPNLLGRRSPGLPIEQLTVAHVERGVCIGVLSSIESQGRLRLEMEAHFAALGRPLRLVAARQFERSGLSFALTVLKPSSGPDAGQPPCLRPS